MLTMLARLRDRWVWLKWTIHSYFSGKSRPDFTEDEQDALASLDRPGTDDQFGSWVDEERHRGLTMDQDHLTADQNRIMEDFNNALQAMIPTVESDHQIAEDYRQALQALIPQTRIDPHGRLLFLCDRCNDYCDRDDDDMKAVASDEGFLVMVCGMCRKGREE